MSEATPQLPPAAAGEPAPRAADAAARKGRRKGARSALWLALLALGLLGWQWYATRLEFASLQEQLARRLAQGEEVAGEARTLAKQNQELLHSLQAKLGAVEAKLGESHSQQSALAAMYQELSRNYDDRVVAEVEQALNLAAQQLQIGANVEAALIALQAAEARLGRAESPQLLPLRKVIHRDIERLEALPAVDLPGMALRLESAAAAVASMPLAYELRPRGGASQAAEERAAPGWLAQVAGELWREVRQLVHIERLERPEPALLAPEHAYFLRENLKLRLMNARLALLQRDTRIFQSDIRAAVAWVERYFDPHSKTVLNVVETLRPMSTAQLSVELPALEDSLTAVRSFKLGRDKAPLPGR